MHHPGFPMFNRLAISEGAPLCAESWPHRTLVEALMLRVTSSQQKCGLLVCRSGSLSSELLDRVVHGFRGLDHGHMPCIGYDPRLSWERTNATKNFPEWLR